jgi:hypothetical protein
LSGHTQQITNTRFSNHIVFPGAQSFGVKKTKQMETVQLSHTTTTFFLSLINLLGIFAFAISGAMRGVRSQMDIFGIVVLGVVTAVSGGILRPAEIRYIILESIRRDF